MSFKFTGPWHCSFKSATMPIETFYVMYNAYRNLLCDVVGKRSASRPSNRQADSDVTTLARCGLVVEQLELEIVITDSKFEAAKLARDLVADYIMRYMKSMASMLYAIEAMTAKQIPLLTTQAR
jgi:hypothetical protein